ncbi:putative PurR-regulated permease PerM [Kitasatospora sp. MAP12-15]|uniref:AI-2E family transporter n=1 Tax=unclassified Kitasatospora TaxID=2633591 RepID=UPI002476D37D|nr:AI-2E family transporter [Kitasatospora sp. MAP12-44]MDH6113803.1 putative PurR-regulated permease PerM [Kitasatospora sp. MAP12-44]
MPAPSRGPSGSPSGSPGSRNAARRAALARRPPVEPPGRVGPGVQRAAGYAWRLLVIGGALYAVLLVVSRLVLPAAAVFVALVITAILRPVADLLHRVLPRVPAVVVAVLGSLLLLAGLLALVGETVAGEWNKLAHDFSGGIDRIEKWLEGSPFHLHPGALAGLQAKLSSFVATHRAALVSTAVNEAGHVVQIATGGALALFCAVFFIHSGDAMWRWAQLRLPAGSRAATARAGQAAWRTFAGYTRGIMIISATNATLVGIALVVLGVPLALPLTVLEFFATLIPLIGSPVALAVAAVVALAAKGPVTALIVLALIVVIGQIEGHLLHPLVMSWAVRIHPVVVALSVAAGGILSGVIGAVVAVPIVSVAWAVICELHGPAVE